MGVLDVTRIVLSVKKKKKLRKVKKINFRTFSTNFLMKMRRRSRIVVKKVWKKMILEGLPALNVMVKVRIVSVPDSIAVEETMKGNEETREEEKDVKIANVVHPWKSSTFVKALVVSNEITRNTIFY